MIDLRVSITAVVLAAAAFVPDAALQDASFSQRPFELPLVASSRSGQPQLTLDQQGRVVLSWLERVGETPQYAFKYAVREGPGWSSPRTIVERDSFFVNWADVPSVSPLGERGLVAHWLQKNGASTYAYDVRLSLFDPQTGSWNLDRLPYDDTSQTEHGFASFFDWPGGGAGIVWLDGREMKPGSHDTHGGGGTMTLRAARIAGDGRISHETRLDDRVCECCPTAAVATPRGAVVAYRDRSPTELRDIAVIRLDAGQWTSPTYVHADEWQINACPVNGPALAAVGDRVALAWFTAQGDSPRALLAFSMDGGKTFGKPVRVDESQTLGRVDVVMLDDGRAVASWLEFAPEGSEFRARIVSPDGTRAPYFTIARSTSDRQSGYPRMVRTGNDLIFAWTATRPIPQVKTALLTLR